MLALAGVGASSASAAGLDVFVGYADGLRATPASFPVPWGPSTSTINFQGCSASSCSLDAGAVRLVNNTGIDQHIDSVVVKMSTCTFDIWPHNITVAPGHELIVTQTSSTATEGCAPQTGSFDTSDVGPNSADWAFHCNQSGVVPEVDVSIGGSVTPFSDAGKVLNTGGVDKAFCGGVNESTQWTKIGNAPCPGASLTISPPSQTHRPVTEMATLTGTLVNGCGQGLQNVKVGFGAQSGPNAGKILYGMTDVNGQATVQYTSTKTGTDTWFAAVQNLAGFIFSNNTAAVIWASPILYTGRAYDAAATLVGGFHLSVNDTGPISTPNTTDLVVKTLSLTGPPLNLVLLPAEVATGNGSSTASAAIASANLALTGLSLSAGAVSTSSKSTCAGATASTSFASLTINGTSINVNTIAPNTTIPLVLPGAKVILNEQKPVPGASQGVEVNAIHIIVPGIVDVVIVSSRSDIHNC